MFREYLIPLAVIDLKRFLLHLVIRIGAPGGPAVALAVSGVRARGVEGLGVLLLLSVLHGDQSDFHYFLAGFDLLHGRVLLEFGLIQMLGDHRIQVLIGRKFTQGLFCKRVHCFI